MTRSCVCLRHDRVEHLRKQRITIEAAGALVVLDAIAARDICIQLVQLKQRLNVIADKTDGHDDDVSNTFMAQSFYFVFQIWLEPGHFSVPRLESEGPRHVQTL